MNETKLQQVRLAIQELEEKYGVIITSRGGSYGSSRIVIVDTESGDAYDKE